MIFQLTTKFYQKLFPVSRNLYNSHRPIHGFLWRNIRLVLKPGNEMRCLFLWSSMDILICIVCSKRIEFFSVRAGHEYEFSVNARINTCSLFTDAICRQSPRQYSRNTLSRINPTFKKQGVTMNHITYSWDGLSPRSRADFIRTPSWFRTSNHLNNDND